MRQAQKSKIKQSEILEINTEIICMIFSRYIAEHVHAPVFIPSSLSSATQGNCLLKRD